MKFQQCCEAKFLTTNNIDAITNSTGGNFQRGFLFYIEVIIIFFKNRKQEDIQSRAYLQAICSWLGCPLHSSVSIFNYFAYMNWLDTATGACPSVHVCLVRWLSHRFSVHRFLCHLQSEAKTTKVWHFYRRTLRLSQWIVVLFLSYTVFCLWGYVSRSSIYFSVCFYLKIQNIRIHVFDGLDLDHCFHLSLRFIF